MNTPPPSRSLTLAQLREQAEEASQLAVAARQEAGRAQKLAVEADQRGEQASLRLARVLTQIAHLQETQP